MILRSFLALSLLAAPAFADFSFVHVSDIHVGAGHDPSNGEIDAKMFKEISQLEPKPKFVMGTGDICENGTPAQYAEYREVEKSLGGIPFYMAPGNHDVRWNPLGKEGFVNGAHQPLFQSWDYKDESTGVKMHFVLLDSCVLLEHWGHIDQHELDWLKKDLDKTGKETPVVIGFHHGIAWETVFVDNEQQLLDLVAPYNVRLWLQGHGHADIQWNINGAPAEEVAGLYQQSYAVIEVSKDHMTVTRRMLKLKAKGELIGGNVEREVVHKTILTIPLAKQIAPEWEVKLAADARGQDAHATVEHGNLPADAELLYRVDTGKYQAMNGDDVALNSSHLTAGEHVVTVQAKLADGRVYQKPLKWMIEKQGVPEPKWVTNIGGAVQSTLLRSGEKLWLTTMGGDLVALNAADGKEISRVHTGGAIFSSPIADHGTTYFGSADHNVYAVDENNGKVKWKYKTGGGVFGSPAVAQGIVAIASVDKKIYGIDVNDGQMRWTAPIEGMYQSKAATDGERFYFAGWDNQLRCIDAKSGKQIWDDRIGHAPSGAIAMPYSPAIASPAVGDGQVFVCTNDGTLHACDLMTGKENWSFCNKRLGYSGPLYHDGKVFVSIGEPSRIFCLESKSGKLLWMTGSRDASKELKIASSTATPVDPNIAGDRTALPVIYDSSAAYGDRSIYIGSVDGTFNAIDAESGKVKWQYRLGPGHLLDSATADEKCVYISSMSGRVFAFEMK